jgi:hypothetical protein
MEQSVLVGFTARTRDLYGGLMRGGGFARTLVRGALRPGVLAATSGAAGLGVRRRSSWTRRATLGRGRRSAAR